MFRSKVAPFVFAVSVLFAPSVQGGIFDVFKKPCSWFLKAEPLAELFSEDDYILANGIAVTGDDYYPTYLVLNNLELDEATIKTLHGKMVLSVGEGFSGLVPLLNEKGVSARGLDTWYDNRNIPKNDGGKKMRSYVKKYEKYLIAGDAMDIPLHDASVDLVVSHMVVNNMNLEDGYEILKEAFRVTKSGGEVRIYGFSDNNVEVLKATLDSSQVKIEYKVSKKYFVFYHNGEDYERDDYLLTIKVP